MPHTSHKRGKVLLLVVGAILSALLLAAAWWSWVPIPLDEAIGFVAGAWCVWLAVKQNPWTWPIGITNNVAYVIVFWRARLYGGMALQGLYIAISLYGIYSWLRGGEQHKGRRVSHCSWKLGAALAVLAVPAVWRLTLYLRSINDAAPFPDALTTIMSLAAQFMLARKHIENWYVWIAADVIYIGLYLHRELYLTALLYFIFLLMCVAGAREWRSDLARPAAAGQATA
jgi:nicotinamide mononucleotide transporter